MRPSAGFTHGPGWLERLRAALYALYFYGITLCFGLGGLAVRLFAPARALPLARLWARALLAGLRPICGITVIMHGREYLPASGPMLLASQHQSEFDTLIWMVELARPSYVMKQELTRLPLVGPLMQPAGMIPVDRAGGAAALRRLLSDASRAHADGRAIVIFPEGTRLAPGTTGPLHPGISAIASRLDLPVFPVATDSGIRWGRSLLGKRRGPIHIVIGPAISPRAGRAEMLEALRTFWATQAAQGFGPVDNSVERSAPDPL